MLCNSGEVLEKTPLLVFQTLIKPINRMIRLDETNAYYIRHMDWKRIYRSRIQFINDYIGAVSHSVPGQLQVCGPAKPDNHCLKCPNFWLLQFHVDYQLWFLYVFVFVANIEIRRTETNNFCDVCEGDTGLRTDPFTLVSAHNIPGRRWFFFLLTK